MIDNLSEDEHNFLKSLNVPISQCFDANGLAVNRCRQSMKDLEKIIAYNSTLCGAGHKIRTRSGHCIQCDTSRLRYSQRYAEQGYIYIAGSYSSELIKIGSTNNYKNREASLNGENYGGLNDWELISYYKCKNSGKIETTTHTFLQQYIVLKEYQKNRLTQTAREIFKCNYKKCKEALYNSIGDQTVKEKYENIELENKYTNLKSIKKKQSKKIIKPKTVTKKIKKIPKVNSSSSSAISLQKDNSAFQIQKEIVQNQKISEQEINKLGIVNEENDASKQGSTTKRDFSLLWLLAAMALAKFLHIIMTR